MVNSHETEDRITGNIHSKWSRGVSNSKKKSRETRSMQKNLTLVNKKKKKLRQNKLEKRREQKTMIPDSRIQEKRAEQPRDNNFILEWEVIEHTEGVSQHPSLFRRFIRAFARST